MPGDVKEDSQCSSSEHHGQAWVGEKQRIKFSSLTSEASTPAEEAIFCRFSFLLMLSTPRAELPPDWSSAPAAYTTVAVADTSQVSPSSRLQLCVSTERDKRVFVQRLGVEKERCWEVKQ